MGRPEPNAFSYVEAVIAISILAIVGSTLLPMIPQAIQLTSQIRQREILGLITTYVSEYVTQWADFSPTAKMVPFDFYSDGSELELSGDLRVNHLQFLEPMLTSANLDTISDYYKASIKFYETASVNRAVLKVRVWYDENLNDVVDPKENVVDYTTILIEKRL